jgi:hypothetical protein
MLSKLSIRLFALLLFAFMGITFAQNTAITIDPLRPFRESWSSYQINPDYSSSSQDRGYYGADTGFVEYAFSTARAALSDATLQVTLSGEFPGAGGAPSDAFSDVAISLNGKLQTMVRVIPDDDIGQMYLIALRARDFVAGVNIIRFEALSSKKNGIFIYTQTKAYAPITTKIFFTGQESSPPNPISGQLSADYIGIWYAALVAQINPQESYSLRITLSGGRVGQVVGTIEYPSLECGGTATLQSIRENEIELLETITYGNCINLGTVQLSRISRDRTFFFWQKQGSNSTVSGIVERLVGSELANRTAFVGTWQGSASEGNSSFSMLVSILPITQPNELVAVIVYPSLRCGGYWRLERSAANRLTATERLDYGLTRCANQGTIDLIPQSNSTLRFEWRLGNRLASGTLYQSIR